ncbi:MAG: Rieske 2Fe-2S domain-containing protein [Phormidesmis sp.]
MFPNQPWHYRHWYIACTAKELRQKPLSRTVLGIPLVLFRAANGEPVALLDRCPHRNMPLSKGWLQQNSQQSTRLVCPYHGWQFDQQGRCQEIPGLCVGGDSVGGSGNGSMELNSAQNVTAYPAVEQQGFIWVYPTTEPIKDQRPYQFPLKEKPAFSTFSWQMTAPVSMPNAAENFLDATHTHFVHAGLVRTEKHRHLTTVKVTRGHRSAEAIYADEQQISGLVYQVLAPGCTAVVSIGRFLLPSIAQIEYKTDKNYRLFMTLFMTPVNKQQIRAFSVVTFCWGLPNWLGRWAAGPLFYYAMRQDLAALLAQARNIERFGDEQFCFTELDVLRPHIDYLLNREVEDSKDDAEAVLFEKTVFMKL